MKKKEGKMLTVKEVAAKLGAAQISVRIWVNKGRFPGARKESTPFGDFWLIPETALVGFEMGKAGRPPKPKKGKE
jgi:hypothetical protein